MAQAKEITRILSLVQRYYFDKEYIEMFDFKLLGISYTIQKKDLEKKYKELSLIVHPDKLFFHFNGKVPDFFVQEKNINILFNAVKKSYQNICTFLDKQEQLKNIENRNLAQLNSERSNTFETGSDQVNIPSGSGFSNKFNQLCESVETVSYNKYGYDEFNVSRGNGNRSLQDGNNFTQRVKDLSVVVHNIPQAFVPSIYEHCHELGVMKKDSHSGVQSSKYTDLQEAFSYQDIDSIRDKKKFDEKNNKKTLEEIKSQRTSDRVYDESREERRIRLEEEEKIKLQNMMTIYNTLKLDAMNKLGNKNMLTN